MNGYYVDSTANVIPRFPYGNLTTTKEECLDYISNLSKDGWIEESESVIREKLILEIRKRIEESESVIREKLFLEKLNWCVVHINECSRKGMTGNIYTTVYSKSFYKPNK